MRAEKNAGLSSAAIKLIAIFAMTVDHVAWVYVPAESVAGGVMHAVGRITIPIMCYFIAEGYAHTRNLGKYALRLALFGVLSQLPYMYGLKGTLEGILPLNVMFTLLLGLLAVAAYDRAASAPLKLALITLCCAAAMFCDWNCVCVLMCLNFYVFRKSFLDAALGLSALSIAWYVYSAVTAGNNFAGRLFQLAPVLSLPILYLYNGKRGPSLKWLFYAYYPLHLAAIGLIRFGLPV